MRLNSLPILAAVLFFSCDPLAYAYIYPIAPVRCPLVITRKLSSSSLNMGMFDMFKGAFSNAEYSAPPEGVKASARHILVKSTSDVDAVTTALESGSPFREVARQFSTCPSGSKGGDLGSFGPGTMVKEFDEVIFNPESELGTVLGPVKTQFGYHMIVVDKRTGV
mmetsp:Transcript_36111/g.71068  ORF Transcript_36111/g.71068 Transcript_36111/m.71068 type:complete len:165 (+) Transcript_36111:84-578(+)|eukprot:CAMPEP_0194314156 /NCGR_PEP_ID=MMETSP0171-20130528/10978_1 /TAXON_ID=218684 /ORGANISM="Corethron pennatum, Strain L29A3" /LENGTH=164 /DNA_ID=CAMNT_0039069425 /DNA_START=30 /DNA_END=524 /DNA_ORIENTATION=-